MSIERFGALFLAPLNPRDAKTFPFFLFSLSFFFPSPNTNTNMDLKKQNKAGYEGAEEAAIMKIRITLTSCNVKSLEKGLYFFFFFFFFFFCCFKKFKENNCKETVFFCCCFFVFVPSYLLVLSFSPLKSSF